MKILVPTKRVPDPDQRIRIAASGQAIEEDELPFVVNPFDAIAIEEALRIRDENRTGADEVEVVVCDEATDGTLQVGRSGHLAATIVSASTAATTGAKRCLSSAV